MAPARELPCDADGNCMVCGQKAPPEETLACTTCATPWHVSCLPQLSRPQSEVAVATWQCPDCSGMGGGNVVVSASVGGGSLVAAVREIECDDRLTEKEKAKKRQELLSRRTSGDGHAAGDSREGGMEMEKRNEVMEIFDGTINCSFCLQLPERPITTPCGHNFCLKCFQKWIRQGKRTCVNCRKTIPRQMVNRPRINSVLVSAIRMAKVARSNTTSAVGKTYHFVHNRDRPDTAFTTDRAVRPGMANASSGQILVTVPLDHFGPILAENDPRRNQGVLVGESWANRMECRQWGIHFAHVSGISGRCAEGAQSVSLSGGYQDDEDHGDWFLYTGSGGRDLSGNKRTNKKQSSDQLFEHMNEALRVSCMKGYPVRVIRSHKEKRSPYAPQRGLRYDGIYRIEKCWRKKGIQGFLMCRYLFVRCDNEAAPWASEEHGDRPRPLPVVGELEGAVDITERKGTPSWDYEVERGCWTWVKPPPISKRPLPDDETGEIVSKPKRNAHRLLKKKLLKEFKCSVCRNILTLPLTTPCGHNFCEACLEGVFAGKSIMRERSQGGRSLRARRNVMKCPSCPCDIAEFLQNPQVNRELTGVIESLKRKIEEEENKVSGGEANVNVDAEANANAGADANADDESPKKEEFEEGGDESSDEEGDDEMEEKEGELSEEIVETGEDPPSKRKKSNPVEEAEVEVVAMAMDVTSEDI